MSVEAARVFCSAEVGVKVLSMGGEEHIVWQGNGYYPYMLIVSSMC